jgi:flagellar biosynthesis protein FlhA
MPNEAPRMADTSVTDTHEKSGLSLPLPSLEQLKDALWRGDLFLALGVMTILVVLIMPMPPFMLDLFLAVSIIFSVLVMMTALFIHKPLEFSAFPTVLLIATMMRWR